MPAVPSDEEFRAYNQGVISEFRANHGVVSQPPFPILLLTTTGARTGRQTTVPLGFAVDDKGRVFVVASKAGAPRHPAWFHNLRANPTVTVELGDSSYQARTVVTAGEERERLYRMVSDGTSAYEKNTDRAFPVVVLEGVPAPADRLIRPGWVASGSLHPEALAVPRATPKPRRTVAIPCGWGLHRPSGDRRGREAVIWPTWGARSHPQKA